MRKYSTGISITALVIALAALGFSLFQNWGMQWDSVMFAVAMLSGLVMLLIGWQIMSYIELRDRIDDRIKRSVEPHIISAQNELKRDVRESHYSMLNTLRELQLDTTNFDETLIISIEMLYVASELQDEDKISKSLDGIDTLYYGNNRLIDPSVEAEDRLKSLLKGLVHNDKAYSLLRVIESRVNASDYVYPRETP